MIKTILIPVLVGTLALSAHASSEYSDDAGPMVPSSQNFQSGYTAYAKDVHLLDSPSFWYAPDDRSLVSTTVGLSVIDYFLRIDASDHPSEGLKRLLVPRAGVGVSADLAYTAVDSSYSGFYCSFKTDLLEKFDEGRHPEVDGKDRLVLWCRGDALYVTAGRFGASTREVSACDYKVVSGFVPSSIPSHEVVLRVIPDIQTGAGALGFAIWLDGQPLKTGAAISDGSLNEALLTDEARVLISQQRLFPSLTVPGVNESVTLGGVAFTGNGSVDDFNFTTEAPAPAMQPLRVFTLRWDVGVKAISYKVGSGSSVTVPSASLSARNTVFEIPASATTVSVTATYDSGNEWSKGSWGAEGACSVSGDSFVCDASSSAAVGIVRSTRPEIALGDGAGAYASFADAKEAAIAEGKPISLTGDFTVIRDSRDGGCILINRGETVTIDLKGRTLRTACEEFPTIVNYGNLTIVDSVGGGRVKAYADFTGEALTTDQIAVNNYATFNNVPSLTIKGGIYDGFINNVGMGTSVTSLDRLEGRLSIVRREGSDEPKFISTNAEAFEFGDKLADGKLYYTYSEPYWQPSVSGAFIWCGKGSDDDWSTAANWRCNAVPGAGDLAIFPAAGTNLWVVDLGAGIAAKNIQLDGDVFFTGSADFTDVTWKRSGNARVSGDAVLTWKGKLPPVLTTLLDETWAGTVAIVDVGNASPKLLTDMAAWGTEFSTVRFQGVRGYYHSTSNLTVPWALELIDGSNGYAWKNDAGFTGGVIEFPALVGSGTFVSPKNTIANRQVIVFREVVDFKGLLDVQGKRVVLGPGEAATLEAGSITWSDKVTVTAGVAHQCVVAAFGGTMSVNGTYGDVLANYSGSTVGDSAEVVTLLPGDFTAELCVNDPVGAVKIARWSENAFIVNGRRVVKADLGEVNSKTLLSVPVHSLALKSLPFAAYYTPTVVTNGVMASISLALNELAVPVLGAEGGESATMSFDDGLVSIVVSDVIGGFWYGLEYKASLNDDWNGPEFWTVAEAGGGRVELIAPADDRSGFYRVVVSDVNPTEGDAE